jgi:hypothetical protein
LARAALSSFILINLFLIAGCTSSTAPTYSQEKIEPAIQDICKNEYKLEVKAKLVGATLWIYLPVEDIFVKADKPNKTTEIFKIEQNKIDFEDNYLKIGYAIKKVPPQEQLDNSQVNKEVADKLMSVWKAVRRVLFSLKQTDKDGIKFFSVVIADIKEGFEIKTINYCLDLKKVSYNNISVEEYQHRTIQETNIDREQIISDKVGRHLIYKDIGMEDFVVLQIASRIRLKFQKPELDKNADIDKEVFKIVAYTLKIYGFKDFGGVELANLLTKKKIILNRAAILSEPNGQRF